MYYSTQPGIVIPPNPEYPIPPFPEYWNSFFYTRNSHPTPTRMVIPPNPEKSYHPDRNSGL
eukprot:1283050-Prorocentrum_lima.AAC.1